MKFIIEKEKGREVIVPRDLLKISGIHKEKKLVCYPLNGVLVLMKRKLDPKELGQISDEMEELALEFACDLDAFCDCCEDPDGKCPCTRNVYDK